MTDSNWKCPVHIGTEWLGDLLSECPSCRAEKAEAEVERLRALIDAHRSRVWALHRVEHPEDSELYNAAGRGEGE
jgi:hypothetical protein